MLESIPVELSQKAKENLSLWLDSSWCDEGTKETIRLLLAQDPTQIENGFYTTLSFGTGGLRGVMGVGPNRMNIYTIRQTTKGIANYLIKYWGSDKKPLSAVIGYDSRNNSQLFAQETARVFAASGFVVHLFDAICPTPLVSFACRQLQASVAVMITASHNPPEYNGYKVYWNYGGQVLPPHDRGMIDEVLRIQQEAKAIDVAPLSDSNIQMLSSDIDTLYLKAIEKNRLWESDKSSLKVVYSCLHGTGGRLMKRALEQVGVTSLFYVEEQMIPDGDFPTVKKPNPEEKKALQMGIEKLLRDQADIFIATDPDADRLGVVQRIGNEAVILTGNQMAVIVLEWVCRRLSETLRLPQRPGVIKTIVTSSLFQEIAQYWGAGCANVLTGFKYVADEIEAWSRGERGGYTYIFGAEESYGSLFGLHARDKDAIATAAALAEIAWFLKKDGKTLVDALYDLYEKYGAFHEDLLTFSFDETKEGRELLEATLTSLRKNPLESIAGERVAAFQDLETKFFAGDKRYMLSEELPCSEVLIYTLQSGTQVIIRPSGTEPKVKVYMLLKGPYKERKDVDQLAERAKAIGQFLMPLFSS